MLNESTKEAKEVKILRELRASERDLERLLLAGEITKEEEEEARRRIKELYRLLEVETNTKFSIFWLY